MQFFEPTILVASGLQSQHLGMLLVWKLETCRFFYIADWNSNGTFDFNFSVNTMFHFKKLVADLKGSMLQTFFARQSTQKLN